MESGKRNRKRASSSDVAKKAGVSQSAVSRAFTAGASISKEKKDKILKVAKELEYRPNIIARSLNQQSTKIIGVVMTRFFQTFYSLILGEICKKLQDRGYCTLLLDVDNDEEVDAALPTALQYQVDGLIITSATLSSKMVDSCLRFGTPVILFNRYSMHENVDTIFCDSINGGRMIAQTFLDDGHKRFAYISGVEGISTSRDREQGFENMLKTAGTKVHLRDSGDFSYETGYAAAKRLLNRKDRPDAVFCANDLMAIGLLDYARKELKIDVPNELAVAGFDDTPIASLAEYRLTTIKQPIGRLVDATIDRLMHSIQSRNEETVITKIPGKLIKRDTTRNLKKKR